MSYVVHNPLRMYEENYARLHLLLPRLESLVGDTVLALQDGCTLNVSIVERSPYTSTLTLSHAMNVDERFVRALFMKIRVYRDARVAEVLSYQNSGRFKPLYPYPNPSMFQPYEKRRVNQFLGECLSYCLRNRVLNPI